MEIKEGDKFLFRIKSDRDKFTIPVMVVKAEEAGFELVDLCNLGATIKVYRGKGSAYKITGRCEGSSFMPVVGEPEIL